MSMTNSKNIHAKDVFYVKNIGYSVDVPLKKKGSLDQEIISENKNLNKKFLTHHPTNWSFIIFNNLLEYSTYLVWIL